MDEKKKKKKTNFFSFLISDTTAKGFFFLICKQRTSQKNFQNGNTLLKEAERSNGYYC